MLPGGTLATDYPQENEIGVVVTPPSFENLERALESRELKFGPSKKISGKDLVAYLKNQLKTDRGLDGVNHQKLNAYNKIGLELQTQGGHTLDQGNQKKAQIISVETYITLLEILLQDVL